MTRKPDRLRRLAAIVFLVAIAPALFFGLRTYGSFRLLRSAYEAGAPMTSSIRAWMTLKYVALTYHVSDAALIAELGLPSETDPNTSLKTLAEHVGASPSLYAQRAQRAVAALLPTRQSDSSGGNTGWFTTISASGAIASGQFTRP